MWVLGEGCFEMSRLQRGVHLWQTVIRGGEFLAWIKSGLVAVIFGIRPSIHSGGARGSGGGWAVHRSRATLGPVKLVFIPLPLRHAAKWVGSPFCLTLVDWNVVIGESRGSLRWCLGWPFNQFIYCTTNAYMRNRSAFNLHCVTLPSSSRHSAVCSLSQCFYGKY